MPSCVGVQAIAKIWSALAPSSSICASLFSLRYRITREVTCNQHIVELTTREFNLLEYLMRSPGRVFTRTQILEHIWGYDFNPNTNVVDVCVQRIRKKIDSIGGAGWIESIRGVGYRFREEGRRQKAEGRNTSVSLSKRVKTREAAFLPYPNCSIICCSGRWGPRWVWLNVLVANL
jgi:DNA-binding winged helix-turn-helix (wHTH) protein